MLQSLSAGSLQQIFNFSSDMHDGLGWTAVIQLLTLDLISKTFFSGITELVNNVQHSVGKIQHFCVLKDDRAFTTLSLYIHTSINLPWKTDPSCQRAGICSQVWKSLLSIHYMISHNYLGSPPNLTNSSLLAVQVVHGVICHVVAIIEKGNPFQDLIKLGTESPAEFIINQWTFMKLKLPPPSDL